MGYDLMNKKVRYDALVNHFITTGELGHYNVEEWSIMLYGIPNNEEKIRLIKSAVSLIVRTSRIIILDPNSATTNISILDIEL